MHRQGSWLHILRPRRSSGRQIATRGAPISSRGGPTKRLLGGPESSLSHDPLYIHRFQYTKNVPGAPPPSHDLLTLSTFKSLQKGDKCVRSSFSPQPSALSLQPSALSPQPSALNPQPQPSALHPQASGLRPQASGCRPPASGLRPQASWHHHHVSHHRCHDQRRWGHSKTE